MTYRKFNIDEKILKKLSTSDRKVLEILSDVVKDVAKIYEKQKEEGFYPKGVTKKEIEKQNLTHNAILSPFTFVSKKGKDLVAIPYYKKYSDLLIPISRKIEEAAKITTNSSFKKYLKIRAKAIIDGSYTEADIAWLNVKNSALDFSIGPFERYLDRSFFIKRVYQAHVGIIDEIYTKQAEEAKETLYASAKMSFDLHHSTEIPKKGVAILIERTPYTSGYIADVVFSGENFPCDLDVMQQYGSRIIIYGNQLKLKFDKLHYPVFKTLFEKRFSAKYSKDLLLRATGWNIVLYELGRQLHKYIGARERLKEFYGIIDQTNCLASGITHCKHLVVKGLITQDELEAIIIMHVVWMFSDWLFFQNNKGLETHVKASSILLNYYLETGALKQNDGIAWPNFYRMFFELEKEAKLLVEFLEKGTYKSVGQFVDQNTEFDNFKKLGKNLKLVPKLSLIAS